MQFFNPIWRYLGRISPFQPLQDVSDEVLMNDAKEQGRSQALKTAPKMEIVEMRSETFKKAVAVIFRKEGGYVNNPRDNGGMTNKGITYKTLARWRGVAPQTISERDMRGLSRQEAEDIYYARYWQACRCDDLPDGLDLLIFDFAVNSGPARAAKFLQAAVRQTRDGIIGGMTLRAVSRANIPDVISKITADRIAWLKKHEDWDEFGNGWTKRFRQIERKALKINHGGSW